MGILSLAFLTNVLTIVFIDFVLAGDNAIVIGLASRKLPLKDRRRVLIWGTMGAVILRIVATIAVVWLLKVPGLLLVGGLIVLWIAYKFITDDENHEVQSGTSFWSAIGTIIMADTIMSLDNVLAVGGASRGSFLIVIIGLVISIPFVVWGSSLFLKLIDKFPIILYLGAGILAWTAGGMIAEEPFVKTALDDFTWLYYLGNILLVCFILLIGRIGKQKKQTMSEKFGGS